MGSKKEQITRFGMASLAILFLITSVGFSILVIWQAQKENDEEKLNPLTSTSEQATNDANTNETQGENMIQGTQLQNFTPVADVPTLQKIDTVEGSGAVVQPGQTVTAHYTGAVAATGVIFQSSHDGQNQPIPFGLDQVIKGWTDGVPGMKVGGTRRLIIPADQAYGANPPAGSGIPANAPLVFDIELVAVQ